MNKQKFTTETQRHGEKPLCLCVSVVKIRISAWLAVLVLSACATATKLPDLPDLQADPRPPPVKPTADGDKKIEKTGADLCAEFYAARNDAGAAQACRPLAEQGDAAAQYRLGMIYRTAQAGAEAAHWLGQAGQQGYAPALQALGEMSYNGEAGPRNPIAAREFLQQAARLNLAPAQFKLALLYYHGAGIQRDYPEAARWLRLAAEQGYPKAQLYLGEMYANGKGFAADRAEAMKWLRGAAPSLPEARLNLGILYANSADYYQAFIWLSLATLEGNNSNQALVLRDQVMRHLSPAQLAQAQMELREWNERK
jgi:TPR repeat protein